MAKKTLLDMVQGILSDADADQVNNIGDTEESNQCARIIQSVYYDITDQMDVTHQQGIKQLEATSASTPNVMTRPEGFYDIEWIQYDYVDSGSTDQRMEHVTYLEPVEFLRRTNLRTESDSNVEAVATTSGFTVLVKNDKDPEWWTFLEGQNEIVFDSYDSAVDTNLQKSKSLAYGKTKPTLSLTDTATLDLPRHLEIAVENIARAVFFDYYAELTPEVDRRRRRSEVRIQRQRRVTKGLNDTFTGPDYGRK